MGMKDLKKLKVLIFLATLSAGILVISNIVAVKLWDFFGISVDGGLLIFPLSYVLGDIMVELYGKKLANYVIYVSFFLNVLAVLIFVLVGLLPVYEGWAGQASYDEILGFVPRIVIGSLVAYLVSGVLNNWIFEKIREKTGEKKLWVRFLGSSVFAKVVDNVIFKTIAFWGVLGASEFFIQLGFAYVASLVLEIIMIPVSYFLVGKLRKYGIQS